MSCVYLPPPPPPDQESDEEGLAGTLEAIADLPPCNKDTLAFLILHLQKVAAHCDANKMPLLSLAKVFGPTVVGHGSANPSPSVMWADSQRHAKVGRCVSLCVCD